VCVCVTLALSVHLRLSDKLWATWWGIWWGLGGGLVDRGGGLSGVPWWSRKHGSSAGEAHREQTGCWRWWATWWGIWWGLAGATWLGDLVAVLLPWRKKSQRPVRAFKANANRTDLGCLMACHIGENRKGAPQRETAARTAGSEENYCVIALRGRKSATSVCIKKQIRSQQRTWDSRSSCPSATSVRRWLSPPGTSGLQKSERAVSKEARRMAYALTTNDSLIEN
jgi:hypothetical protein